MNTPRIESRHASTSVRSPIIVNQLGAEIRAALVDHWSRPLIIDHPADRAPWEVAPEADVLLTRPLAGWHKAPADKPAGWPFGLRWIQTASTGVDFFPAWLLDGPVVTVGRGISADPIAEYVVAAILGFAKRLHDIRPRTPGLEDHSAGLAQRHDDRDCGVWRDWSRRRRAGEAVRRADQGTPENALVICAP